MVSAFRGGALSLGYGSDSCSESVAHYDRHRDLCPSGCRPCQKPYHNLETEYLPHPVPYTVSSSQGLEFLQTHPSVGHVLNW